MTDAGSWQTGEAAHDILAAEAFAVPGPDPRLRHALLPEDPMGIPEPHDILAAEEFAMPAPGQDPEADRGWTTAPNRSRWAAIAGLGLLAYWVVRRR